MIVILLHICIISQEGITSVGSTLWTYLDFSLSWVFPLEPVWAPYGLLPLGRDIEVFYFDFAWTRSWSWYVCRIQKIQTPLNRPTWLLVPSPRWAPAGLLLMIYFGRSPGRSRSCMFSSPLELNHLSWIHYQLGGKWSLPWPFGLDPWSNQLIGGSLSSPSKWTKSGLDNIRPNGPVPFF